MEASTLTHPGVAVVRGPMPLLRLQSDERLVAMVRRGHHTAYEALVSRYQARLLSFCRHMLGSREDAEDVLQEVFAAAFNAILADDRPIKVRPWLYRIARNRSLNHLRRATAIGVDSMDIHLAAHGQTTSEKVFEREAFRDLIADVQQLAETQRTALLLREIDALSYEQIAEAMETTVPSVKSLLVRARVSLAESAEARRLTCDEVRFELGQAAEGLMSVSPPARRHVRHCERCHAFKSQLRSNNRALAALLPVGPLVFLKQLAIVKFSGGAGGAHVGGATAAGGATVGTTTAGGATVGGATAAAGAGAIGAVGSVSGAGLITAGAGAIATKAVVGFAAAALVTAAASDLGGHRHHVAAPATPRAAALPATAAAAPAFVGARPTVVAIRDQRTTIAHPERLFARRHHHSATGLHLHAAKAAIGVHARALAAPAAPTSKAAVTTPTLPAMPKPPTTQVQSTTTVLPSSPASTPVPAPVTAPVTTPVATPPASLPPVTPPPAATTPPASLPPVTPPSTAPSDPTSPAPAGATPGTGTVSVTTSTTSTTTATTPVTSTPTSGAPTTITPTSTTTSGTTTPDAGSSTATTPPSPTTATPDVATAPPAAAPASSSGVGASGDATLPPSSVPPAGS